MTLILGIDPGSRKTGFGLVNAVGSHAEYVASGIIRLPDGALPERLKVIFESLSCIIEEHHPETMAIEDVFFARDPRAALKLGQARGIAMVVPSLAAVKFSKWCPPITTIMPHTQIRMLIHQQKL